MATAKEQKNHDTEYGHLKHKYDRKELVLQNFERKMNYYEMYTLKRASEHNDAEANEVIKRFQNEKFTGGMDNQENYQHAMHESNKFSNTV
jgi:hypothetical protein|tara:strand:- start:305 stop:577 length:273 start_codon:yes stop_codon:yes gene_type:complete